MIKLGIIGTNFISDRLVEASRRVPELQPTAVYSRGEETGRAFMERHGLSAAFTSLEEMLDSVDAVYIASPTFMHYRQARTALLKGKHVLCEKMMTLRLEESKELFRLAEQRGLVLMEAMRPLHDPSFEVIRESLPMLGEIRRVHLEFCQYSSRYDRFKAGIVLNAFDPTIGNSALADIGIYPLAVAVGLFGEPVSVSARSMFLHNGFEGMGELSLDYGQMQATVSYSKITDGVRPSVIEGEEGSITVSRLSASGRVELILRSGERRILHEGEEGFGNMEHEIRDFAVAVNGVSDHSAYTSVTLSELAVVESVYRQTGITDHFKY